jgi:trigger factor
MSVGESKDVDFQIPQQDGLPIPARFEVTLKDVKERKLPPLDDELATSVSEFDTLAELRDDLTERLRGVIQGESDGYLRATVLDSLAEQLTTPVPDVLVQVRVREMLRRMVRDLESRGIDADQYLAATGQSSDQLVAMFTAEATDSVRKDLALEAVADAEGIEVSDQMVEEWVREQAVETGEEADAAVERLMGDAAILTSLRTDLKMQKALDIVAESANEITPEQAEARERLWTPEKDSPAAGEKATEIWTPGSAQPADR